MVESNEKLVFVKEWKREAKGTIKPKKFYDTIFPGFCYDDTKKINSFSFVFDDWKAEFENIIEIGKRYKVTLIARLEEIQ
jgi:hypothetical protein